MNFHLFACSNKSVSQSNPKYIPTPSVQGHRQSSVNVRTLLVISAAGSIICFFAAALAVLVAACTGSLVLQVHLHLPAVPVEYIRRGKLTFEGPGHGAKTSNTEQGMHSTSLCRLSTCLRRRRDPQQAAPSSARPRSCSLPSPAERGSPLESEVSRCNLLIESARRRPKFNKWRKSMSTLLLCSLAKNIYEELAPK